MDECPFCPPSHPLILSAKLVIKWVFDRISSSKILILYVGPHLEGKIIAFVCVCRGVQSIPFRDRDPLGIKVLGGERLPVTGRTYGPSTEMWKCFDSRTGQLISSVVTFPVVLVSIMAAALGSFTAWLLSFFVLERIWTRVLEEVGKVVEVPDIENIKSYGEGKNFEIEKIFVR